MFDVNINNQRVIYHINISGDELRQAFLSEDSVSNMINKIIYRIYKEVTNG